LFVYGTLKSNFKNYYARRLRREAILLGNAHMPGRLYRIRWYPGMLPPRHPADAVRGELYKLRQPSKTLKALDEHEEQYARELHCAVLETGQVIRTWVYVYQRRLLEEGYIPSGAWPFRSAAVV
jgi:gamma-glutamylcyclotransferase (GGCT)/AIG2-like uncharacterized protein YtfP